MMRVALKGLAGRKLRSGLTAVAIILGVAMVSGTYILTDTIENGFGAVATQAYKSSDAVISPKTGFGDEQTGAGGFPAAVLDGVRRVPAVRAAAGSIVDEARLIDRGGDVLGGGSAPPLAFGIDPRGDESLTPLQVTDGELPARSGEIAIGKATAQDEGYAIGDTIEVATSGPSRNFRIVGLAELGGVGSLGGSTIAVFELRTAQSLFDKQGKLDLVRVAGDDGVTPGELLSAMSAQLPPTVQLRTGEAQAAAETDESSENLELVNYFLLAFGAIALFVGSFVIANTLSITIAQRTRELATLRTLGASRRQVLISIVVESLVVGLLASIAGLLLGLGLAQGLNALLVGVGIDLPSSGTVFATRTVIVSLLVGVIITLLASIRPAVRATRVPPIAAVRDGAVLPPSRLERHGPATALLVLALAVAALLLGTVAGGLATGSRLLLCGVGAILLFVGIALVAPRVVKPLASVLGWPATRIGGFAGRLARANSTRNPSRTASTAAALMIGLTLVTFVAILGQGLRGTFVDSVDELFVADYALTAESGFAALPPEIEQAAAATPGVQLVSAVRSGSAKLGAEDVDVSAVDRRIGDAMQIDWHRGSDAVAAQLGRDGAFVTHDWAQEHDLSVGSPLQIATPTGKTLRLTVRGIWREPKGGSPFGELAISHAAFADGFPRPRNDLTFVNMDGGVSAASSAALERGLDGFPHAKVQTGEEFKDAQVAQFAQMLNVLYVLLALSVIVSLFGIVNTLVLTVFERTRELGMLRAVGMSRRQVRRMIRHESIITALLGATLGILAGVLLAALVSQALADEGVAFAIPYGSLVAFLVAAVIVGLLAAILPARRAARLNVLRALQYE